MTAPTTHDFLARGYLPRQLPPCISSTAFADAVEADATLRGDKPHTARPLIHYVSRPGSLSRKFAIPNPFLYLRLVDEIVRAWPEIASHIDKSPWAVSKPDADKTDRATTPKNMFSELGKARRRLRDDHAVIVRTDISQFFGSIYTHGLPWSLHGKAVAKRDRSPKLLGNRLDLTARNMQDGQTVGLPIGPDTSHVLAELLLAPLDEQLRARWPTIGGVRMVDDMEFGVDSEAQAHELLADLQLHLSNLELSLNPKKTWIVKDPPLDPVDPAWLHALRPYRIPSDKVGQLDQLREYYRLVFDQALTFPEGAVITYGLAALRSTTIHPDNWIVHQQFLFEAMRREPCTTSEVMSQLIRFREAGLEPNPDWLSEAVNRHVLDHARHGHGNELAWGLWAVLAFDLSFSPAATEAASRLDDSVVAIMLRDAEARGLLEVKLSPDRWEEFLVDGELYGEQWLYCYEVARLGWVGGKEHRRRVEQDSNFGKLLAGNVAFYTAVAKGAAPPLAKLAALLTEPNLGFSQP